MGYIKRNILFIDDDPSARALIQAMLKQAGHVVEVAGDPFEALELLDKYAFDLILLDILMPKLSGIELLKRLKSRIDLKDIPVIMLSVKDDDETIKTCLEMGAADYVIKPPQKQKLLEVIDPILDANPRFAEVDLENGSSDGKGQVNFDVEVLSLGESGMVLRSPIPFDIGQTYCINSDLLLKIGVKKPDFRVLQIEEDRNGSFLVYFTLVGLSDNDIAVIRKWAVEHNQKRTAS